MAETLNMIELPIGKIKEQIKDNLMDEIYDPIIILGKMGMGKTAFLKEMTKELGIGYCELRLVNMTETDMLGIPTINTDGATTYASNDLLPRVERDGEVGVLAIDEITSCSATMRAAAYQLLDGQRSLGNYKLPDKWLCVALGNGPDDGGVFNGAEAALFTRCYGFRVAVSVESWKAWAVQNDINPTVVAYLTFAPDKLHTYNPDDMDGLCASPRTWEKLSKLLNSREKRNGGTLPIENVNILASASVGIRDAGSFSGFYQYKSSSSLIDVADIINGNATTDVSDVEPEAMYITLESLVKELKNSVFIDTNKIGGEYNDETYKKIANVLNWVTSISNSRLDYSVTAIRDLASAVPDFGELALMDSKLEQMCTSWPEFINSNLGVFK